MTTTPFSQFGGSLWPQSCQPYLNWGFPTPYNWRFFKKETNRKMVSQHLSILRFIHPFYYSFRIIDPSFQWPSLLKMLLDRIRWHGATWFSAFKESKILCQYLAILHVLIKHSCQNPSSLEGLMEKDTENIKTKNWSATILTML